VSVDVGAILGGWHGDGRPHVPGRRGCARSAGARRGNAAGDHGRHSGSPAGRARRRHLGGDRGHWRGQRLRHRPTLRRPRDRHPDARGSPGAELPNGLPWPRAPGRHVPGDRADVHARFGRRLRRGRRLDRHDQRRRPGRPLRAHHRDHGDRDPRS
jgi:hypothetical protein